MLAKYTKWMNIWKNLISLDSSQHKVFLGIFWEFFIFLNLNLNLSRFVTGRNRNRSEPVWPVTGKTGPVPVGIFNPAAAMAATAFKLLLPSETITLNLNRFLQVCEQFSACQTIHHVTGQVLRRTQMRLVHLCELSQPCCEGPKNYSLSWDFI